MILSQFSHYPKQKQGKTFVYTGKGMNNGNLTYLYDVRFNKDKTIKNALIGTIYRNGVRTV